jgi:uncharacterized C2H2 Zn-finger protein
MRQKAAAAVANTKASVESQLQQYRQQQQRGEPAQVVDLTSGSTAAEAAALAGQEVCQQCGARFSTVQQLIEHAETTHAAGWSSGAVDMQQQRAASGGGLERCPHCGQGFADVVQLVAHVERQHAQKAGAGSSDNCVVC